jgi:hypothetical protein
MSETLIEPDVPGVVQRLAFIIEKCANEAIDTEDIFKIGLSGKLFIRPLINIILHPFFLFFPPVKHGPPVPYSALPFHLFAGYFDRARTHIHTHTHTPLPFPLPTR